MIARFKQKFYEKAYPRSNKKIQLRSTLGGIYLLLKKFELHREDAVYHLLPKTSKFLDIGCGDGSLVIRMLNKCRYVYGIDIAETRLSIAEGKRNKLSTEKRNRLKFLIADGDDKLPFPNNTFASISMVASLEHFFNPCQVLVETTRILKSGGILVIQVPNLGFLSRRIAVLLGNLPVTSEDEKGWDGGHLHYFTVKSLIRLLESNGFAVGKITCSGIFARLRSWWVSLLGADIIISAIKK